MANLIVTLLSDQTIPNVQFIKEKSNENDFHLFVSTKQMNEKGVGNWIRNVCKIADDKIQVIEVDKFSLADIESKLKSLTYSEYEHIFVNVTGGTKIMFMGVADFFKQKKIGEIYYVSNGQNYLQIAPKNGTYQFSKQITVSEYFNSYGITFSPQKIAISKDYTLKFLDKYLNFDEKDISIIKQLNDARNDRVPFRKNKKQRKIDEFDGWKSFLEKIEFPLSDTTKETINNDEIKYLTGEWYEQWCYFKIQEKFNIPEDHITTGIKIRNTNNIDNELDVAYMYQGSLYIIECKTSVITLDKSNILTDTIYKQAAIKKNFGLSVKLRIFTLSSKEDKEVRNAHLDRARDFDIEIKCKEDLVEFLKEEKLC
jgi:hypothetical protein